jgi:hypothetical protein
VGGGAAFIGADHRFSPASKQGGITVRGFQSASHANHPISRLDGAPGDPHGSPAMESPYSPPAAAPADAVSLARSKRFFGWAAFVCAGIFVLAPLVGLAGAVKGLVGAFTELQNEGAADPSVLAGDISVVILSILWSFVFSSLALIPFVVFLVLFLRRRKELRSRGEPSSGAN